MADDRANYLDHLERWLNYEDELDSPQVTQGIVPPKPRAEPSQRKRVDSFVDGERRKVAHEVSEQNKRMGAPKPKCVADLGKVARMEMVAPLPSCARDEEDQRFAGGPLEEPGLVETVAQKVKDVLGIQNTW